MNHAELAPPKPLGKLEAEWIMGNDTGTSSKTIFAVMTSSPIGNTDVPHDSGDFGCCYRLLGLFPEWRSRLPEVAKAYPEWGQMIKAWNELTELYQMRAYTQLDDLMRTLVDAGRVAAGWEKTGPGSGSGPGVKVVSLGPGLSLRYKK